MYTTQRLRIKSILSFLLYTRKSIAESLTLWYRIPPLPCGGRRWLKRCAYIRIQFRINKRFITGKQWSEEWCMHDIHLFEYSFFGRLEFVVRRWGVMKPNDNLWFDNLLICIYFCVYVCVFCVTCYVRFEHNSERIMSQFDVYGPNGRTLFTYTYKWYESNTFHLFNITRH